MAQPQTPLSESFPQPIFSGVSPVTAGIYPPPPDSSGSDSATTGENLVQFVDNYGVGIDTHSKFIQVCVLVRNGDNVSRYEESFTTAFEDLIAARRWIYNHLPPTKAEDGVFHYTIESTGTYHFPVLRAFEGIPRIVNPLIAGGSRRKTDVLDSRLLAHHDITGLWKDSFVYDDAWQAARVLAQRVDHLRDQTLRCRNRLNQNLLRFGHTFGAVAPPKGATFRSIVEDLIQGKIPDVAGVCPTGLPPAARRIFRDLLGETEILESRFEESKEQFLDAMQLLEVPIEGGILVSGKDMLETLASVPGIGKYTAARWLVETSTMLRFPSAKAVVAYCGLDPTLCVSAGKVTSHKRRGGNKRLSYALRMAGSLLIARRNEPIGQWGYNYSKRHKQGGWKKACAAVARRLAIALYYVHLKNDPFTYDKYAFWRQKDVPDVALSEMGLGRFESVLTRMGFEGSKQLVDAYYTTLPSERGIGEKCLNQIHQWIKQHAKDSTSAAESSAVRSRKSRTEIYRRLSTRSSRESKS